MCQTRSNILSERPVTDDGFLGGRLSVLQPVSHGRAGIDTVFLAAAVPAQAGQCALELGSGIGVASLCLGWRVAELHIEGHEIQPELVSLARENARRNGMADRVRFARGDVRARAAGDGRFDHVLMNPPYFAAGTTRPSRKPEKALAHTEVAGDLADWVGAALRALRPRGVLTMIQRTDRLGAVLKLLDGQAGDIAMIPLWPAEGRSAKRVILRARKGSAAPPCLLPGLVLHEPDGTFTKNAQAILGEGGGLFS